MSESARSTVIDISHFRRVLGQHPKGVAVITAIDAEGNPVGMTVSSFNSVSLDPPLVAFLPARGSRFLSTVTAVGRFAVNVLAGDQIDISRTFASAVPDRFHSVGWRPSPLGSPVLDGALAWIDCRLHSASEAGDHMFVVGEVESLDVERAVGPLISFQSGYGRFSSLSMVTSDGDGVASHLRLAELARPRLERISRVFGVQAAATALVGSEVMQVAWTSADDTDLATNMVGLRLPFIAPFGLMFAAWASDDVREAWIAPHRQDDPDDAIVRSVLESVERARAQGWIALPDHARLRDIERSIARIAAHGELPEAILELDAHNRAYARAYARLAGDQPRGVGVPVFDHTGQVVLALTAQRMPAMERDLVDRCRDELVAAAAELTSTIQGMPPKRPDASVLTGS